MYELVVYPLVDKALIVAFLGFDGVGIWGNFLAGSIFPTALTLLFYITTMHNNPLQYLYLHLHTNRWHAWGTYNADALM